jgi:methylthioribose-1-phosphate isomerase
MSDEIFSPLRWSRGVLYLLDQLRLPSEETWLRCESAADVSRAIRAMHVRGAPAIGCAAAYGVALAARRLASAVPKREGTEFLRLLEGEIAQLAATRPTAVNLFWALSQMRNAAQVAMKTNDPGQVADELEERACGIHSEDIAMCLRIGANGANLIPDGATVLTHCTAGALATGGYGTALGVLRAARSAGRRLRVLADETRPFLQGSRLTAWELAREGFDVTIIPDAAAAALLQRGEISCCIVGADRIAANGDVANKIGTYGVALAARAAGVPFYVAAPRSTIDLETASGALIPIEERSAAELIRWGENQIAPQGVNARYPAFDVTPAALVDGIITDVGVARPDYQITLSQTMKSQSLLPTGSGENPQGT